MTSVATLQESTALPGSGLATAPGLDRILRIVGHDLERVNRVVVDRMQSPVALIPELAGHIIAAGGKRAAPVLTLSCARLCGYEGDRHVELAACVEFIHTATLLHDDVVDESDLRRGVPTANAVWDNKTSILVGDFLFSRAFEIMVADGSLKVLHTLSAASATIAEGEVHQLATTNDLSTTEEEYLEVISAKTAKLFEAAAQVGAIVADQPEAAERSLAAFGAHIGMAFQLIDDVLDYSAHQATLGKAVGDDFREGKITLARHPRLPSRRAGRTGFLAPNAGRAAVGGRRPRSGDRPDAPARRADGNDRTGPALRQIGHAIPGPISAQPDPRGAGRPRLLRGRAALLTTRTAGRQRGLRGKVWPLYSARGRSVAQPGRALSSGGRGRWFESTHSDHYFQWVTGNPRPVKFTGNCAMAQFPARFGRRRPRSRDCSSRKPVIIPIRPYCRRSAHPDSSRGPG